MREFLATTKGKIITGVIGGLVLLIIVVVILFATGVLGSKDKKEPTKPSEEGGLIVVDPEDLEEDSIDSSEVFEENTVDDPFIDDNEEDTSTDDKKEDTSTDDKNEDTSTNDKKEDTSTDDKKEDSSTLDSDTTDNSGTQWSPLF